jgi:hypothetical protein
VSKVIPSYLHPSAPLAIDIPSNMVRKAKGLAAVAEDAAPAGVAEGAAPVDERSPLIARSASPSYSAVPRGKDVDARLESNKHFNLAGLGERTFWVLVRCYAIRTHGSR